MSRKEFIRYCAGTYCFFVGCLLLCFVLVFIYAAFGTSFFDKFTVESEFSFYRKHAMLPLTGGLCLFLSSILLFRQRLNLVALIVNSLVSIITGGVWLCCDNGHVFSHKFLNECSNQFWQYEFVLVIALFVGAIAAVGVGFQNLDVDSQNESAKVSERKRSYHRGIIAISLMVVLLNFIVIIPVVVHFYKSLYKTSRIAEETMTISKIAMFELAKEDERLKILCELLPSLENEYKKAIHTYEIRTKLDNDKCRLKEVEYHMWLPEERRYIFTEIMIIELVLIPRDLRGDKSSKTIDIKISEITFKNGHIKKEMTLERLKKLQASIRASSKSK